VEGLIQAFLPLPTELTGQIIRYDEQDEKNKKILIGSQELSFEEYLKKSNRGYAKGESLYSFLIYNKNNYIYGRILSIRNILKE